VVDSHLEVDLMTWWRQALHFAFCFLVFVLSAVSQQANSSSPIASQNSTVQSQSLGDVARKLRKDTTTEVKMTDADTRRLFESVDKIFAFAAEDTGMPKHSAIKRQLVGKADVEKYTSGRLAKEEFTQRFSTAEASMKKLGFLPRDFNLREFLVKSNGQNIAGYYDEETKTISLLNWVSPDQQGPILAHELTHALQDQNYGLTKWMKAAANPPGGASRNNDIEDGAIARKAVIEGQAMVVYVDYMLAAVGRNLEDTPGLLYQMEEPAVKAVTDSQLFHDAPMIMREMGTFSYNEGLIFEGELLHKGGKKMAFAGVFARPPRNSHEVLQPEAYINGVRVPPVRIPDMQQVLSNQYEVYDSGGIGELDVRALLKQYGERKIAAELSSAWQGGAYVTYRRAKAAAEISPALSDLAFLYVSRWKSPQAAERFARFYSTAVSQRYRNAVPEASPACTGQACPVSAVQIATEEGPVIVEHWADNSVVVSESFDVTTAARLRDSVREGAGSVHVDNLHNSNSSEEELGSRLYEIPAFRQFQDAIGDRIAEGMNSNPAP
jgi:hypothetical protein